MRINRSKSLAHSIFHANTNDSSDSKADETQYVHSAAAPSAAAPVQNQANGSKKRAAASPDASQAATQDASQAKKTKIAENAKVGDGQNAKSKQIAISVDEYCTLPSYQVYIDDDGTIWDASLNQTNSSNNNNKFYKVQVCHTILFWVHPHAYHL
jgi:poly [ADP-ribose] polymerase